MPSAIQPSWVVTPEKVQTAVRRIIEAVHPQQVILFGSQVRENRHRDSDLDLLVIMDCVANPAAQSVHLRRLLADQIMGVDVIVVSRERFDYWCDTPGHLFYDIKREGKVVHAAS